MDKNPDKRNKRLALIARLIRFAANPLPLFLSAAPTPKADARRTGTRKQLGRDKYLIRVFLVKDTAGKRHYHTETFHGPARKADDRIREIRRRYSAGEPIKTSADTFGAFLDDWLEAKSNEVAESSMREYRKRVNLYVKPWLGKLLLAQVTAEEIQRSYGRLKEKNISPRMIRHVHDLLNQVFKLAVLRRKMPGSPMAGVTPPKLIDDDESKAMTAEQVVRFLDAARGHRFEHLFRLAFHLGCRPGELLALKWDDLDAKAATIRIDQNIVWRKSGDWYLKSPKTKKSRRTIGLTGALVAVLHSQRIRQNEAKLKAGSKWTDHGFIFTKDNGEPWTQANVYDHFRRVATKAGLPKNFNPYSARHTVATLLMSQGVHPKLVSEQLGHSKINITMDTYTWVDVGMRSDLTAEIERLLDGSDQVSITQAAKKDARFG